MGRVVRNQSILIPGAGIAGPTLAYWLAFYGFRPTLVERAPQLREGGYLIDSGALVTTSQKRWDCFAS